jgi:hypothetical protein
MRIILNKSAKDINLLQNEIMKVIDSWARVNKTPISQKHILKEFKDGGVLEVTTKAALKALIFKGYIRKACVLSNRTFYVQLKWI